MSYIHYIHGSEKNDKFLLFIKENYSIDEIYSIHQIAQSLKDCEIKPNEIYSESELMKWAEGFGYVLGEAKVTEGEA